MAPLAFLCKSISLVTVLALIALEAANQWSPSDTKTWTSHPSTYCQSATSSDIVENALQDPKGGPSGFKGPDGPITTTQCQDTCEKSVQCKFYSYGKWQKGMHIGAYAVGGYYGQKRCQLYSVCGLSEMKQVSVSEKPTSDEAITTTHKIITVLVAVLLGLLGVALPSSRNGRVARPNGRAAAVGQGSRGGSTKPQGAEQQPLAPDVVAPNGDNAAVIDEGKKLRKRVDLSGHDKAR